MSNNNNDRLSSGRFTSNKSPPDFKNRPTSHPIHKMIHGTIKERQNIILHLPFVESVLFINKNRLVTLNVPHIGFDNDEDMNKELLTGALGDECYSTITGYLPLNQACSDTLIWGNPKDSDLDGLLHGSIITKRDKDNAQDPSPLACFKVPLCLPKLAGITIREGHVNDPKVMDSLEKYHHDAAAWLKMIKSGLDNPALCVSYKKMKKDYANHIPTLEQSIPFSGSPNAEITFLITGSDDEYSLRSQILKRVEEVIQKNKQEFEKLNPKSVSSPAPMESEFTKTLLNSLQPKNMAALTEEELLHHKYKRAIASTRLMLVSKKADGTLHYPNLSVQYLSCMKSSLQENSKIFKGYIIDWMNDRVTYDRDFFIRYISPLSWSHALVTMILSANWHHRPLDEITTKLENHLSIVNFLPEPLGDQDDHYCEYIAQAEMEEMEEAIGESNLKRSKKNTKAYTKGLQNKCAHVVTALANMDGLFAFMTPFDGKPHEERPIIVQCLRKLGDLFAGTQFGMYEDKFGKEYPWMPHTILSIAHSMIAEIMEVAISAININRVMKDQPLPLTLFDDVLINMNDSVQDIKRAIRYAQAGIFREPVRSYRKFFPEIEPNKKKQKPSEYAKTEPTENGGKASRRDKKTRKVWLVYSGRPVYVAG